MFEQVNSRGHKFYLHSQVMKNGRTLFFFSKNNGGSIDLPAGYKVIENRKTGLPLLKKK